MTSRRLSGLALASLVALIGAAAAQTLPPPPANIPNAPPPPPSSYPPPPPGVRPTQGPFPTNQAGSAVCTRLEQALADLDNRAGSNPDAVRRYEEAIGRQRAELDQAQSQSRRLGCDRRGFFIFGGGARPEQCNQLDPQIDRMRANLDRMQGELAQVRGGNSDGNYTRDLQRRQIMVSLNQNNCGPQYRSAAAAPPPRPRGFLEQLFGSNEEGDPNANPNSMPTGNSFRTVCVRTCDGFFFPISFATVQSRFGEDEAMCKRQCPAAEVSLYTYSNPGQDIQQAVSLGGQNYSELPNAFKYRTEFNPGCSCRGPGQSWADAVGQDPTFQRGDILVTEQRSKQLSAPRIGPLTKNPTSQSPNPGQFEPPVPTPPVAQTPLPPNDGKRRVRVVGPQFYPVR